MRRTRKDRTSPKARRLWGLYGLTATIWFIAFWIVPHQIAALGPTADFAIARGWVFAGALSGWLVVFVTFGLEITGDPLGALTSGRNRYSLSRLQMTMWTWIILSAFTAAAVARAWGLGLGSLESALAIDIDDSLLEVMGISFFTGAATPALMALKAQGESGINQQEIASSRMGETILVDGQAIARPIGQPTRLGDFVEGDDAGTAGSIDLSKVQQLMITVVLVGIYTAMLFGFFLDKDMPSSGTAPTVLPGLSPDFIKLLLLSHAGYLGYKAVPKPPPAGEVAPLAGGPPLPPDRKAGLS